MLKLRKGFMESMNEIYSRFLELKSDDEIIDFLKSEKDNLEKVNNIIIKNILYERYKEKGRIESLERSFNCGSTEERVKSLWKHYIRKIETSVSPIEMLQINIVSVPMIFKLINHIGEN